MIRLPAIKLGWGRDVLSVQSGFDQIPGNKWTPVDTIPELENIAHPPLFTPRLSCRSRAFGFFHIERCMNPLDAPRHPQEPDMLHMHPIIYPVPLTPRLDMNQLLAG